MIYLHTGMWCVDGPTTLLAQYPPQHLSPMVGLIDYGHEDSVRVDVGYGITRSHATGHSNRESDCEENDKKSDGHAPIISRSVQDPEWFSFHQHLIMLRRFVQGRDGPGEPDSQLQL